MPIRRDEHGGDDRKRDERRLDAHDRLQPARRRAAGLGQEQDRQALPDETHAERDDDRGQIAQMDERAKRGVERRRSRAGPARRASGSSRSQVAETQPTKPTKVPIDRSRSLPAITNICAIVASAIGIARFSISVKPK